MNAVGCERAVRELLRHDYGVTDARIEGGGKHRALTFTSPSGSGARVKTTWPSHPSQGDWGVTLAVKTRDLRRLLGEPIPTPAPPKKEREAKMPEPNVALADHVRGALPSLAKQLDEKRQPVPVTPVAQRLQGWCVSAYKYLDRWRVRFSVPEGQRGPLTGDRVRIEQLSDESWKLSSDKSGVKFYKMGLSLTIQVSLAEHTRGVNGPFKATPAEAVVQSDGSVIVTCPMSDRRLYEPRPRQPVPLGAADPTSLTPAEIKACLALTPAEIKACLATIRRVEAETEYRLVKSKELNDWVFVSRIE